MGDEKFKVVQLKATLKQLDLSQAGDKTTLLKRLRSHDPSGAWRDIAKSVQMEEEAREQREMTLDEDLSYELTRGSDRPIPSMDNINQTENDLVLGLAKDLERMRRENELMRRQLEDLRLEKNRTENRSTILSVNNGSMNSSSSTPRPTITALGELLSEFTGAEDTFWNWHKQLELVRTTYHLDDNNIRILISMKLKQRALQWFRSKPEHLEMPVTVLISQMKRMFDHRPAKMELRRRFEKRIWRNEESFSDYYYDKVILASRVPVDEDELVDLIIDGIPETPLRNQARMHRFEGKEDLLKAFEQITLRPENKNRRGNVVGKSDNRQQSKVKETEQRRENKCYNCNQMGHLAKNCDKPKRERGSCFECGSTDHRVRDCNQKKQMTSSSGTSQKKEADGQISNVAVHREHDNEYLKQVEIQINANGLDCKFIVNSQLDTACPISLIKDKFVPPGSISQLESEHYEGLNGSVLKIKGGVIAKISLENAMTENAMMRVVPDHTMRCDVLIGRDILKKLDLMITKRSNEKDIESIANEILNIEVNDEDSNDIDTLKINPNLSYAIRNKIKEKINTDYLQAEKPLEPKVKAELKLHIKEKQPFHYAPNRLSIDEKSKIRIILDELSARGIIRPSSSEYASRIVLVRKKDGRIRMCVDYRTLNKITARDNYPLPIIEEQIDALQGKRYFTSLDLKDAFHHVYIEKDSIKYTAFVTPFGQFEYTKMPFGLKNAPARFQRYVNDILHDLIKDGHVVAYMDEIGRAHV